MTKKQITLVGALAVVLLAGSWAVYSLTRPAAAPDTATASALEGASLIDPGKVRPSDYTLGNPNAKVVLIEYASPSCSSCAAWNNLVKDRFKKAFIDTGKVLYVFRFYLIQRFPQDPDVAKMAMCLPREQFFPFMDMMYRNQPEWDQAEYPNVTDPSAALVRMGRIAGMSADRVSVCRAPNPAVDNELNSVAMAADATYGITGTPTFIINGVKTSMDFDLMSADIEAALAMK